MRIVGLTSAGGVELNGRCGVITAGDASAERCCVRIDGGGGQIKAVRRDKLEQAPPRLPWCFQFTDRTWELLLARWSKEPSERLVARNCEMVPLRWSEATGFPVKDRERGETAMQHSKVAVRWWDATAEGASCGWVYVGSHNFSAAAWGMPIWCGREQQLPRRRHLRTQLSMIEAGRHPRGGRPCWGSRSRCRRGDRRISSCWA